MDLNRRDLLRLGAAAAASLSAVGCAELTATRRADPAGWAGKSTGAITRIPTMCQSCTTACGVLATIKDGRLLQIVGNPEDPNSRGSVCAKGVAGPSILYDPFRVLYPLRRVGPRGSGQWKRITWEEAYAEIADKLKDIRERGHPEEFAFNRGTIAPPTSSTASSTPMGRRRASITEPCARPIGAPRCSPPWATATGTSATTSTPTTS